MEHPRLDRNVHLSYKDVLLVPYDIDCCTIQSRNDPDISSEVCPGKRINIPLISAPMDSVTETEMSIALNNLGALGIHTRYLGKSESDELTLLVQSVKQMKKKSTKGYVSCAIGVKNKVAEFTKALCDVGLDILCLDIANGNHVMMLDALDAVAPLKDKYNISVIAGNVATGKSAKRLAEHGADAIKVGIGPGAACTTRRVVGFGVPQFSAIMDVASHLVGMPVRIIADGGIRQSGDIVKAIWAGADTVMSGYLFAGHDECPLFEGKRMYRGMASRTVSGRSDVAPEGVCMEVKRKGSVEKTLSELASSIRAACSMANANRLEALRKNVRAIRVSTVSNEESDPIRTE